MRKFFFQDPLTIDTENIDTEMKKFGNFFTKISKKIKFITSGLLPTLVLIF